MPPSNSPLQLRRTEESVRKDSEGGIARVSPANQGGFEHLPLLGIALLGLVLRLAWVLFFTGAIDGEGAEYARIAQNLVSGKGYLGIATPGKELMFPPGFPFLIAAVTFLVHQAELAGRLVSLSMGALLVVPLYFIAFQLHGRNAALTTAAVTAVHPYLISYSGTVYCEPTYLTVVLTGACWALQALRHQKIQPFLLAGAFFAFAYLIRPEAVIYPFLSFGVISAYTWLTNRKELSRTVVRLAAMLALFAVLAAPYLVWLHSQTGQWRLEGKSPLNSTTRFRMLEGVAEQEASYGIDHDLNERGVWIQSNLSTIRSPKVGGQELLSYLSGQAKSVLFFLMDTISGHRPFGSPPLFALAMLGLFGRPWRREATAGHILLFGILGVAGIGLFFIYYYHDRFLLIFLAVMLVWASAGTLELVRWMASTARRLHGGPIPHSRAVGSALIVAIAATVPLLALPSAIYARVQNRDSRSLKAAGQWLDRHAPGPKVVMDVTTILSFHAGASFVPFPYADSETSLRYLDKKSVDFIVLSDSSLSSRPYLKDWMESGIPSTRAKLIFNVKAPGIGRIAIYRWYYPAGAEAKSAVHHGKEFGSEPVRPEASQVQHQVVGRRHGQGDDSSESKS